MCASTPALRASGRREPAGAIHPRAALHAVWIAFLVALVGCGTRDVAGPTPRTAKQPQPYDLNSALFSDYAAKYRFVKLPPGTSAAYHETEAFEFPVGTVIAKTFAYPHDLRDPTKGQRLIETRILKHDPQSFPTPTSARAVTR
jgi:hypothetical protein